MAVERHVAATLGPGVRVDRSTLELGAVIEYFTEPGLGEFCDPRKHAVSMTYSAACECTGAPEARGEAHEFGWFSLDQLPGLSTGEALICGRSIPAPLLVREGAELSPAVVIPGGTAAPLSDDTVPQQIGRTVGRAATKAADLLASLPNLPKFGRKK